VPALTPSHGQTVTPISTPLVSKINAAPTASPAPASAQQTPNSANTEPNSTKAPPGDGTIAPGTDLFGDPLTGKAATVKPAPDTTATEPQATVPAAAPTTTAPFLRLIAPLRLNPMVRDALAAAIESMNGDPRAAEAITVPTGVFIPIEVFKRRHVDIPAVQPALRRAFRSTHLQPSAFCWP